MYMRITVIFIAATAFRWRVGNEGIFLRRLTYAAAVDGVTVNVTSVAVAPTSLGRVKSLFN